MTERRVQKNEKVPDLICFFPRERLFSLSWSLQEAIERLNKEWQHSFHGSTEQIIPTLQVKSPKRVILALGVQDTPYQPGIAYVEIVDNHFGQMLPILQHVVYPGFIVHSDSWTMHDNIQLFLSFQHAQVTVMIPTLSHLLACIPYTES